MTAPREGEVARHLVTYVREEAGIQLHQEDLVVELGPETVRASWEGSLLGAGPADPGADPADLALVVMEGCGDVRARLVEIRLSTVRRHLGDVATKVRRYLASEGWESHDLEALELDVEEDRGFGVPVTGWPRVEVVVTHPGRGEARVEANIHFPEEVVDPSDLTDAVLEGMS